MEQNTGFIVIWHTMNHRWICLNAQY